MKERHCCNCIHWERQSKTPTFGLCHAHPATVLVIPGDADGPSQAAFYFPQMPANQWCGEFREEPIHNT